MDISHGQGTLPLEDFEMQRVESFDQVGDEVVRTVLTRDGRQVKSSIPSLGEEGQNLAAIFDRSWLRSQNRPPSDGLNGEIRIADLFCGAGGISLGIEEATRALGLKVRHVFAADVMKEALSTYDYNFSPNILESCPIESVLDMPLGSRPSTAEMSLRQKLGHIDLVVGGPPCQGHSSLNNHTRGQDPKNTLYDRMARFAEIVKPSHIVIENVPGVRSDKDGVFNRTFEALETQGYRVDAHKLEAERIGVPQKRHRTVLVASRVAPIYSGFLRDITLAQETAARDVKWAIGDLLQTESHDLLDSVTDVSDESQRRIDWLFDNDEHDLPDSMRPDCHRTKKHTYKSVYGRLFWDESAWTITTGFQVMGQGRFLHPIRRRVITPHEAARLQFFPDYFRFVANSRKGFAKLIGNAVPPKLAYVVALSLLR